MIVLLHHLVLDTVIDITSEQLRSRTSRARCAAACRDFGLGLCCLFSPGSDFAAAGKRARLQSETGIQGLGNCRASAFGTKREPRSATCWNMPSFAPSTSGCRRNLHFEVSPMNFNAHGYLEPGIHNADLSATEEHFV